MQAHGLTLELPDLADDVGKGPALDKLHRVVVHATVRADGMHRHDIRVMQERRGLGFRFETLKMARVKRGGERQDLERNPTAERELLGLIDDTHPTPTDLTKDAKIAQHAVAWAGDVIKWCMAGSFAESRAAQVSHHLQRGEQLPQRLGVFGMLFCEAAWIERFASLKPLEELFDQIGQDGSIPLMECYDVKPCLFCPCGLVLVGFKHDDVAQKALQKLPFCAIHGYSCGHYEIATPQLRNMAPLAMWTLGMTRGHCLSSVGQRSATLIARVDHPFD
jgi:hypothetical protein